MQDEHSPMLSTFMRQKEMRLVLTIAVLASGVATAGLALALRQTAPPADIERISDRGTVLVVMRDGCGWCTKFQDNIGPKYRMSVQQADAPMRYIDAEDLNESRTYKISKKVWSTPTIVLVDTYGREVSRSVGYPGTLERLASFVDRNSGRMSR
jgi:thioredoxin-related protein